MKILVFSDSHGNSVNMIKAIELHKTSVELIIFLGDGLRDIDIVKEKFPSISVFSVKGNCDFFSSDIPKESVLDLDGIRVLVVHGDKYNVKYGISTVAYAGLEKEVDAIFFGHTHVPCEFCEYYGERRIQLFNPGSIGASGTYGVVNTSGEVLVTSIAEIN